MSLARTQVLSAGRAAMCLPEGRRIRVEWNDFDGMSSFEPIDRGPAVGKECRWGG